MKKTAQNRRFWRGFDAFLVVFWVTLVAPRFMGDPGRIWRAEVEIVELASGLVEGEQFPYEGVDTGQGVCERRANGGPLAREAGTRREALV